MKHSKDLARAVASLLDLLGKHVPEMAAECSVFADKLREWAGPEASAGPSEPPDGS